MSGLVHAVAIIVLSLLFLPGRKHAAPLALEFGTTDAAGGNEFDAVELAPAESGADDAAVAEDAAAAALLDEPLPAIEAGLVVESTEPETPDITSPDSDPPEPAPTPLEPAAVDNAVSLAAAAAPAPPADGGLGDGLSAEGASRGGGSAAGRARAAAANLSPAASFFGRSGEGKSVCFLCDNSNSYRDGGFHMVLDELARAVDGLRADQSFFVVFFSDAAYPLLHPAPANTLVPATPDNKRKLRAWLQTVEMCRGGQGLQQAVTLAGALEPDVVYLLSDGEIAGSVVDRVRDADFGEATVHTFGIQQSVVDRRTGQIDPDRAREQESCNRNLVAIATAHGGGFTPVIVPPAAAALERLRPIVRNRLRGPIWGLRL